MYVQVHKVNDKLSISINNQLEFDHKLKELSKDMLKESGASKVIYAEVYEMFLRVSILEALSKADFDIEANKSNIVNFNIGDNTYRFNIVKYNHKMLGVGYNISKTILL